MSETDPTAPAAPISAVPPVIRTPGPYLRGKPGPKKGAKRKAPQRTAASRTAEDVRMQAPVGSFQRSSSGMPRETDAWQPEYDGPGERVSRLDRDINQFELPKKLLNKLRQRGFDGRWVVVKILLADERDVDGVEIRSAYNAGWRPAKAKDFPELCVPGTDPNGTIENNGQRFFIRPEILSRKARQEDYDFATAQMKSRMQASQEGKAVQSGEESLADMGRLVRPVAISLEVEGESGTHAGGR